VVVVVVEVLLPFNGLWVYSFPVEGIVRGSHGGGGGGGERRRRRRRKKKESRWVNYHRYNVPHP